jgi:NAD(P)-dependent dehydrogenase (short-subunit alcohol dehydrogenase family)
MGKLVGRRVLITGAGSGLGRALANHFGRRDWQVAVTDLKPALAQETLHEIQAGGGKGLFEALDVTSEVQFDQVVGRVRDEWGGLDVLVNNAGVATAGTVEDSPLEQWQWVFNINFYGCLRGARAAIPVMKAQGGGHIVNVASFAGIANPPALASYNAAKAAVISLSETLRFELDPHQIGVTVACPSFFRTNLIETSRALGGSEATMAPAPQMLAITDQLMKSAKITADDVAADIYRAVLDNRFLTLTHPDAKQRYHLKRLFPELFFRIARKVTAGFLQKR